MNGSRSRAIADAAGALGTKVIVIQTEGRPNNSQTMEYAVGSGADPRGVDLWFTWSDTVRDFMIERRLLPPEKIVTAGVARFDYYREPFRQLNETRESMSRKYGLDPKKPIVTLATNFTNTKYFKRQREFLTSDWKDLGLSKFDAYSDPDDWARRDWDARETTLGIMRELLAARPDAQLVIKPHPTEEHDRYAAFAKEMNASGPARVAFVGLDYIWNVLAMSDTHIHRLCTTGVEAWLMNVPSIDLHVADYHGWSLQLGGSAAEAVPGNDLVSNAGALIARVSHYLGGGGISAAQAAAREAYITKWLHAVDGRRAEAHADAIAALLGGPDTRRPASIADVARVRAAQLVRRLRGEQSASGDAATGAAARADQLGQVDPRITDGDADRWMARTRAVTIATKDVAPVRLKTVVPQ
jgi:surface carbohydrate biosynthesis protein